VRPGRGGSPPCKRRMSGPSKTNPRGAGVCLPPLVGLPRPPRVRVGRLQKGRLVGPEGADGVASVARAAQRGRWSRSEPPGFSQESGSELIPEPTLDVTHFWTDLRLRSAHTPQARRRFAGHRDPRRTFVGLGAVTAVLLITVGFAQLFAFHRIGPSTHSRSIATAVAPTPSATAVATPKAVVTAGRPLSWSRVAFPSAWNQQGAPSGSSAFFGLTPGDESTL
jgi:hypothetical protein